MATNWCGCCNDNGQGYCYQRKQAEDDRRYFEQEEQRRRSEQIARENRVHAERLHRDAQEAAERRHKENLALLKKAQNPVYESRPVRRTPYIPTSQYRDYPHRDSVPVKIPNKEPNPIWSRIGTIIKWTVLTPIVLLIANWAFWLILLIFGLFKDMLLGR